MPHLLADLPGERRHPSATREHRSDLSGVARLAGALRATTKRRKEGGKATHTRCERTRPRCEHPSSCRGIYAGAGSAGRSGRCGRNGKERCRENRTERGQEEGREEREAGTRSGRRRRRRRNRSSVAPRRVRAHTAGRALAAGIARGRSVDSQPGRGLKITRAGSRSIILTFS